MRHRGIHRTNTYSIIRLDKLSRKIIVTPLQHFRQNVGIRGDIVEERIETPVFTIINFIFTAACICRRRVDGKLED